MTSANVRFVLPGASQERLLRLRGLDVDRDWTCFSQGVSAWIVQTYLLLRAGGLSVSLEPDFSRSDINVSHVAELAHIPRPRSCYVLGVRADYPPVRWCQAHVVQNQTQVARKAFWLPHWPQPGLLPRDPQRGSRVERVGYFGRQINYYSRYFRRPSGFSRVERAVSKICNELHLELVQNGPESWNDYRTIDIALGIRRLDRSAFNTKPPTKLLNAWLAGALFVSGNDSAFRQVGKSGLDYLAVTSRRELQSTLERIQSSPETYAQTVRSGTISASFYSREAIRKAWHKLFEKLDK